MIFPPDLQNNDFQENEVDLEVALILQPLLRRNGKNVCDVPVIARQVILAAAFLRGY